MEYLEVGKIVTTHGIKGELKILPSTSFVFERFKDGVTLYFKQGKNYVATEVTSARFHKNFPLITLDNKKDINLVMDYVGKTLYIKKDDLAELEEDEFYYDDLIGLDAVVSGETIGKVIDVLEVPQGEILKIEKLDQTIAMVPFVNEFIGEIDLEEEKIEIIPIEGLLWELMC